MKNYPNKLISVKDSVLMSMLRIIQTIPSVGIACIELQMDMSRVMDLEEFVEAMTNLFAISYISIDEYGIIKRLC